MAPSSTMEAIGGATAVHSGRLLALVCTWYVTTFLCHTSTHVLVNEVADGCVLHAVFTSACVALLKVSTATAITYVTCTLTGAGLPDLTTSSRLVRSAGIVHGMGVMCTTLTLAFGGVAFANLLKALEPFAVLAFSAWLLPDKVPSNAQLLSGLVCIVGVGTCIASRFVPTSSTESAADNGQQRAIDDTNGSIGGDMAHGGGETGADGGGAIVDNGRALQTLMATLGAMGSMTFFAARNVLFKRWMIEETRVVPSCGGSGGSGTTTLSSDKNSTPPSPSFLHKFLLLNFHAMRFMAVLAALVGICVALVNDSSVALRELEELVADAPTAVVVVTTFTGYQYASAAVLRHVERPFTHALLNLFKRLVSMVLALWLLHEWAALGNATFVAGAALVFAGLAAYTNVSR